jgi:hypothetical protein
VARLGGRRKRALPSPCEQIPHPPLRSGFTMGERRVENKKEEK